MCQPLVGLLAIVCVGATPSVAEDQEVTTLDRIALWNECKPTHLLVEELPDDAKEIRLTVEAIEVTVRSRLRAARLYTAGLPTFLDPYLYVSISANTDTFYSTFEYNKPLRDDATGFLIHAETWDLSGLGRHGGDAAYVLSILAQNTDEFIDEYLRVNEEACSQRHVPK